MTGVHWAAWAIGAGYVAGFLGLTLLASRRAGRSLWLFDRPGQSGPAWGFRLAFAALVLWPLAGPGWSSAALWLLPVALGVGFALFSQAYMGRSWRIGTAEGELGALVDGGPFRLSRNPTFVGQIMLAWGLVPLAGLPMLAGAVLMTVSAVLQVRSEERVLSLDPAWRDFADRTPRWIGPI